MIKDTLKAIWNSRVGLAVVMFLAGGIATYLFMPEKIKVEIKTETIIVEKIVEKEVIKVVEKEVIKYEKVKVVKRKTTWPDGKIEEEEIYESESQQIDRMTEKYQELLKESEQKWEEKYSYLKEQTNPKRFNIFGGLGLNLDVMKRSYVFGLNASFYGPFTMGVVGTTNGGLYGTVGLRF
jgi:hypothetical protein